MAKIIIKRRPASASLYSAAPGTHVAKFVRPSRLTKLIAVAVMILVLAIPAQVFALDSDNTKPAAKGESGQSSFQSHEGYYSSWSNIDHALKVDPDYAHKPFGKYTDLEGVEHLPDYDAFGDSSAQQDGFDDAIKFNEKLVGATRNSSSSTHWGFNVKSGKDAGTFGVSMEGAHIWETGKAAPVTIDIKITVTDYTVQGKPDYAYIAIEKNHIDPSVILLGVKEAELTYQYFLHGTDKAYDLKTNLTYSDIDDHQYVAVGASNIYGIYLDSNTNLNYGYTGSKNMIFADMEQISGAGAVNAVGFAFSSGTKGFTLTFGNNESNDYVDYSWFGGAVYGMFIATPPDPWKDVSDSDETKVEKDTLTDESEEFTYSIYQDVPSGMTLGEGYDSFVMKDQIDTCLEIRSVKVYNTIGGATHRRANWTKSDGVTDDDWFVISVSAGNLVTATAKKTALENEDFYGGGNRLDTRKTLQITVRWDPNVTDATRLAHGHKLTGTSPLKPGLQDGWKVKNEGTVIVNEKPQNTGSVETDVHKLHKEVTDSNESLVTNNAITNAAEPFYYTLSQYVPAKSASDDKFSSFAFTDSVESCLTVTDVRVYRDGLATDVSDSFDIVKTNSVRAAAKASVLQTAAFYGHEYTVKITALLKTDVSEATLRAHGHYVDSDRNLQYNNEGKIAINGRPAVSSNTVITKVPVPDLKIEKSVMPYENQVGDIFRYTVAVSHAPGSAGDAVNVRIWDNDIPEGVSISGITIGGLSTAHKSVAATKGGFEFEADVIKRTETAVISFDASAAKELNGTIVTNTAFVSCFSDTTGDWTAPKKDDAEAYINSPKLNVVKTAQTDGGEIEKGDEIHYKAVITNLNPGTFMRDCIFYDEITQAGIDLVPGSITVKNSQNRLITNSCDITVSGNAFRIEPRLPLNIAYEDMAVPPKERGRNESFPSVMTDYANLPLENRITVTYSVNISEPDLIEGDIVNTMVSPSRPNTNGDMVRDDPDVPSGGDEDTHVTVVWKDRTPPEIPPEETITPPAIEPQAFAAPSTPAAVVTVAAMENTTPPGLKVEKKNSRGGVPHTGDGFDPITVALIMACAGALTAIMLIRRKSV
ncbi:MAG: isopeptide-forming domain-containing fimbrial protein [Clostridiales Family XIII bacterium]|jgi:fimbrial isopeptide formation D2 family protein|nr:isopeptide-forming domain-containing fimbrial protein [Clostridiales Family XIII bacterium]